MFKKSVEVVHWGRVPVFHQQLCVITYFSSDSEMPGRALAAVEGGVITFHVSHVQWESRVTANAPSLTDGFDLLQLADQCQTHWYVQSQE